MLACASEDYHVIMASRSEEKAKAAMSEIEATGDTKGKLSTMQLDVTDEKSIDAAASYVQEHFGHLDILVNNAGVGGLGLDIPTQFRRCLETNVTGPAMVSAAFRPLLLRSKNPYSIYVGSGERTLVRNAAQKPASHQNIQSGGAYQVSKAALNMLAVLEFRDYGAEGLKVFVMSPGFVRSNLRGTSEEARSGWGGAGDPEVSGELALGIIQGKRDADVGCLVHKGGVFPW